MRHESSNCGNEQSWLKAIRSTLRQRRFHTFSLEDRFMTRDKLVILSMFGIAAAIGLLGVGYHHWLSHRAIRWWGDKDVSLVVDSPDVDALLLEPITAHPVPAVPGLRETYAVGGQAYLVTQEKHVSADEGLYHLRHGMVEDANFAWSAPPAKPPLKSTSPPPGPRVFGLQFKNGTRQLTVLFDPRTRRMERTDTGASLTIAPIATGWDEFFAEQF